MKNYNRVFSQIFLVGILCLSTVALAAVGQGQEAKEPMISGFKPVCVDAVLTPKKVRPGGQTSLTLRFRNDGKPPESDYLIFVHLEFPEKDCRNIVSQADHMPSVPTSQWMTGCVVEDGPYILEIPANSREGTYCLHVGVYSQAGVRFCDEYVAEIIVSKKTPAVEFRPPKMAEREVLKRRTALAKRLLNAFTIENDALAFSITSSGSWAITDKTTGEIWHSNAERAAFGEARVAVNGNTRTMMLDSFSELKVDNHRIIATHDPIRLEFNLLPNGVRFSYEVTDTACHVESIRLLDKALWVTDVEGGVYIVPHRLGILVPASEGLPRIDRYSPYSNYRSYSMAMLGAVKNNSALLVHWDDAYVTAEIQRTWQNIPIVPAHGMVSASLILSKSAKSFVVSPVGRGGIPKIAQEYRKVVARRGLLETWHKKIARNPDAEKMLGAADFKPFVFVRAVPGTVYNKGQEDILTIGYTFDEAVRVAEHLRHDVGIERALFVLAGWIRRGYDNQHPDILPSAPECGGDEALADCARRVNDLGYLFGLHDNYQDMYRDAPSWDESFIMKRSDGSLFLGGVWAGGQAYLTCSKKALELAQRPQNLPAVERLFHPKVYFIDTTFAAPPFECFDPDHPLSLNDDIHWKRKLCEYARQTFGLFGSEEGQEWGVPCTDYFEGLMSHRTQRSAGEIIVPIFEMVFGDCINLYTHQGDRASPSRPEYILDHLLYAEMPIYNFGSHLYFENSDASTRPFIHSLKQLGPRRFEITYAWEVLKPLSEDCTCFVHFTQRGGISEDIVFQNDHKFAIPSTLWKVGEIFLDGPHTVEIPKGASGDFGIMVGLLSGGRRVPVQGMDCGNLRFLIGGLRVSRSRVQLLKDLGEFLPCFAQGDAGSLNTTDRFIKNTYEVLSPLNRVTAFSPMTSHEFLNSDRSVERTRFGDVEITVNYSNKRFSVGSTVLPKYGFLVESPKFVAFYALEYGGLKFTRPTMAAVESLDEKPISVSTRLKIFRAFGDKVAVVAGRRLALENKAETE